MMVKTRPKLEKATIQTPDLLKERLAEVGKLLPEAFSEGKLDMDKLKKVLGDLADDRPERYTFSWAGKRDAIRLLQVPAQGTLVPDKDQSVEFDKTENMIIEGDNLEVLKLLYRSYFGRVKMIYIDPPYNRDADTVYEDNYEAPLQAYLLQTEQITEKGDMLTSKPDKQGRLHSRWLSMMYPRLFVARQLLSDDGVIFVSIDDNEVHNLRLIMNGIFGEENFVNTFAWQARTSRQNDTDISINHEYIVAYAKNRRKVNRRLKPSNIKEWYKVMEFAYFPLPLDKNRFSNPDNDSRGDWAAHPFDAPGIRKNLSYKIKNPKTGQEFLPPRGRHWRVEEEIFKKLLADKRIVFGVSGEARPLLKYFYNERKDYGRVDTTWFTGKNRGTVTEGTSEIQELFDGIIIFDFPKPTRLIRSLLTIATKNEDFVIDFFAGSGTTAHAVMELNKDGGNRKFILVQLPEPTLEDSEARKAGYKTISEICRERVRRVIKKIKKENAQEKLAEKRECDLGFKAFTLAESNFRSWKGVEGKDAKKYTEQMALYVDPLKPKWKPEDVIWEVALKEGFGLCSKIEKLAHKENIIYKVTEPQKQQSFLICLDGELKESAVRALNLDKDDIFICRDVALSDELAANLALQCRLKTI